MKKRVMIAVGCVSALVALTATADTEIVTVCQGMSGSVPVDLVPEAKSVSGAVTLTFATSWAEGAPAGAEAVVEVDGETLVCTASEYGTHVWIPPCDGTFTLKHKVFAGGEQIGDTLTATIVADGIPGVAAVGPAPDGAELVCAAESAAVKIDLTPGTRTAEWTERLFASPEWGGWAGVPGPGAYCVVELDGELVSNSAESVSFDWTPTAFGTYSFTHRVFSQGGTQIGETLAATFNVAAKDIALAQVAVDCSDVTYSGSAYTPAIQSAAFGERTLVEGTDYTLAYLGNVNAGTATITLTGINFFNGTYTTNFTIRPKALTSSAVGAVANVTYTGSAFRPEPAVTDSARGATLAKGSDYSLSWGENTSAGSGSVTVTGKGNYTGTVIKHFSIAKATYDMSGARWDYPGAFAYDGTAKSVHVSSLPSGVTAAYTGNTAAAPGTYTAHAELTYDATNYNKPEIADLVWVIKSAEETKLKETFDGLPAEIAPDGEGGWIVTVTNDIDSADLPIEIPDNLGAVTIDLNGHDIIGGDGRPAIAVVPGEGDGEPTQLTIANSGDDAIVQGGEGSPAIEVYDGAKDGVLVNIGEGVTVQGGDDFTPAIDGEAGTNEGTIVEPVRIHIPGEGAVTVPKTWKTGQKVTWKAKAAKGSVFARWEGAFVDSLNLSENERRDPALAFIVPAGFDANLISAVFIPIDDDGLSELSFADGEGLPMGGEEGILFELKADVGELWLVDDSRSYVSATASGLPPGLKFNAKKMSITGAPTRSGVYWVQVKAKNASGYQLAVNARMAVSGYTKETAEPKLAKTAYHPLTVVCATEGGTVAGTGVYAEGKKVSVSARPDRGRVFAGWYRDAALERPMSFAAGDWRAATQSVTVPEVRYLFAKFVTADDDKGSIELGVNGAALSSAPAGTPALATNVWAGVALRWRLAADALSSPTVKVAGLPPGLKFTAKDIMKKGSKTEVDIPANTVYGAPTAASKVDAATGAAKPYAVKVTVTTAGKSTQVYQIDAVVDPLPAWAAGAFGGECGEPGGEAPAGTAALTIAASGKISGKVLEGGRTWTLSAGELSRAEHVGEGLVFYATAIAKAGGDVATNLVAVAADDGIGVASGRDAYGHAGRVPPPWAASQNLWKRADTKAEAPVFRKNVDVELEGGLRLTFKKDGVVAFSGTVDGAKVSGSSQLVRRGGDQPGWQVTLYAPPKGAFKGWCETFEVTVATDGQNVVTGVDVGL